MRMFGGRKFLRAEDGAGAAEFALVVLPMTVLTFFIIQAGALFFAYNDLHNAAREGVRRLAVQDGIAYGDGITLVNGTMEPVSFNCGGTPPAGSVEEVVCNYMAGWDNRVTVTTGAMPVNLVEDPQLNCHEVIVRAEMDMGDASIFGMFGILNGRTLRAEAMMISEYDLVTGNNLCE